MRVACLDIAQTRNIDAVYVDFSDRLVRHQLFSEAHAVLEWCTEFQPTILAIDGPSKRNLGRTQLESIRELNGWKPGSYQDYRVCEALLRQQNIGLYNTSRKSPSDWIKAGWKVYDVLKEKLNYHIWDLPGKVDLREEDRIIIEVHPHACFVVGLGWIPPNKKTLSGQLVRMAYLHRDGVIAGETLRGSDWPSDSLLDLLVEKIQKSTWDTLCRVGLDIPNISHDKIDALSGLVTAIKCVEGQAHAVGEFEEGVIVLPGLLLPEGRSYKPH